jgi:hypothetical protein
VSNSTTCDSLFNPGDLEMYVTELQKVYGALEEPDFLSGLAAVRRTEQTLMDMIHQHTILANFQVLFSFFYSLIKNHKKTILKKLLYYFLMFYPLFYN